jgi:hypothetical protein
VSRRVGVALLVALVAAVPVALAASFSYHNSLGAGDPTQKSRLVEDDPASSCTAQTDAAVQDSEAPHYDRYGFTNSSGSKQCVTVELALDPLMCPANNSAQSAAYSPRFDPSDITVGYLGDSGARPNPSKSYSFEVPAGASFEVTVNETNPNAGCNSYTLTVSGAGITTRPTAAGVVSLRAKAVRRGIRLR